HTLGHPPGPPLFPYTTLFRSVHVRAQNSGFIQLAEEFSAGRGAIGENVTKGQLLASIADEATARQLKQAGADLQAATERAKLPRSEEHTSELQSREKLVCRLL